MYAFMILIALRPNKEKCIIISRIPQCGIATSTAPQKLTETVAIYSMPTAVALAR